MIMEKRAHALTEFCLCLFLAKIDTSGLGTSAAIGIALACVVLLILLLLNGVVCYRKKRRQRESQLANHNQHYMSSDVSTISYGDDSSQRALQGLSFRLYFGEGGTNLVRPL